MAMVMRLRSCAVSHFKPAEHCRQGLLHTEHTATWQQQEAAAVHLADGRNSSGGHGVPGAVRIPQEHEPTNALAVLDVSGRHGAPSVGWTKGQVQHLRLLREPGHERAVWVRRNGRTPTTHKRMWTWEDSGLWRGAVEAHGRPQAKAPDIRSVLGRNAATLAKTATAWKTIGPPESLLFRCTSPHMMEQIANWWSVVQSLHKMVVSSKACLNRAKCKYSGRP